MAYLLVPHDVSTTAATVWIGAINENPHTAQVVLLSTSGQHALNPTWENWVSQDAAFRLDCQRVRLAGLQPRKTYALELRANGEHKTDARLTTLPDRLPTLAEKPFTVLLGSCFCRPQDEAGRVGHTYFHLPSGERPDVKMLCGDQVYLDAPWDHYLAATHTAQELENEFFTNYLRTWKQTGAGSGFRELLKNGANYFCADDHEFWNNAPNAGIYVRDTWTEGGRGAWFSVARCLYQRFQSPSPITTFSVGPLSFLIADMRINRRPDRTAFMHGADLETLAQWIGSLRGPGVLVISQPVFSEKTGFWGRFTDWGLPDFEQYVDLVRLLARSSHSIIILTGDVHYGRVAHCSPQPGVELVEVISSPMALVDPAAKGEWEKAPEVFPAFEVPGVVNVPVQTEPFSLADNHFLTLAFSAAGARVKLTVKAWPIVPVEALPPSTTVYEGLLS